MTEQNQPGQARTGEQENPREPGRTATEAEGGERSPQAPQESTRTQDRAEGDPATVDEALEDR